MASITKRGHAYSVRIRRSGYPTLARSFDTKKEAQRWATSMENDIDRGSLPVTMEAERTTLAHACDDYRRHKTPSHKGAAEESRRLRFLAKSSLGILPLAKLNSIVIEDYVTERMKIVEGAKGVAGSTVNRELGILVQVLRRARKQGWMQHNPMEEVDRPKDPPPRERRLTDLEIARIKLALKKTRNRLFIAFIAVSYESGMRRGEQLSIDWPQTDLEARVIHLRGDQTKNGHPHDIPLSRGATEALRWLHQKTGKQLNVFQGLTTDAIKKCWQRLVKWADVKDFHLHDLRHERVSSLIDAGWNHIQAMAVSGHKDMRAFRRYAHPKVALLVNKLDEMSDENSYIERKTFK